MTNNQAQAMQLALELLVKETTESKELIRDLVVTGGMGGGGKQYDKGDLQQAIDSWKKDNESTLDRVLRRVGEAPGKALGVGKDVGAALLGKFMVVLGPLAMVAQVLSSNASGMQVFMSGIKLLAATLAPVLLPIIAVLAAALIELSNTLWDDLEPALTDFYKLVMDTLYPAVMYVVKSFGEAAGAIIRFMDYINPSKGGASKEDFNKHLEDVRSENPDISSMAAMKEAQRRVFEEIARNAKRDATRLERDPEGTGRGDYGNGVSSGIGGDYGHGTSADNLQTAVTTTIDKLTGQQRTEQGTGGNKPSSMDLVIQELKQSIGPKASISGVAQASRNAQLAALNQSPIEALILQRMIQSVEKLEQINQNTKQRGVS